MKTSGSVAGTQVYSTDFKTPAVIGLGTWIFLIGGSFGYLWILGYDMAKEWQANKEIVIGLTVAIVLMTILFPLFGWQRIEIDESQRKIRIRNFLDRILAKTREFNLKDIQSIETRNKPRRGTLLYIQLKDRSTFKVNLTNLKDGRGFEKYLKKKVGDLFPERTHTHTS